MSGADPATPSVWRSGLRLAGVAALAVLLLGGLHRLGAPRIAAQAREAERDALSVVLPSAEHDNDLLADQVSVHAPHWLGSAAPLRAWRARRADAPRALLLEAVAPDGYGGPIRLLIGVRADGRISGVRVLEHRETPGLGDIIDAHQSRWIDTLRGRRLGDPPAQRWTVRRDGGEFDQVAGATVTPRAVLLAVRRALAYVERHGAQLYAAPSGSTLEHDDAPG
jgi:Na+-translocating ferredoxin:NAD+ oxidoreductase subunit G